jgi:hypothetical protein
VAFFKWFGRGPTLGLQTIATDMWEPFLRVIAERVPWAINVLNRYHITANVNKAVDKVRAEEARALDRMVDEDDGAAEAALDLAEIGEQRGDLGGDVLVDAVEPHEGVEDDEPRPQGFDLGGEVRGVGLDVEAHDRVDDLVDVEAIPRDLCRGADPLQAPAHDVGRILGGVQQYGCRPRDARSGPLKQRVDVALVEQLAADGLAGAALEQDVVGDDDGGAAVDLEQRFDVLDEVELLVGRAGPEVLALVADLLALGLAGLGDDEDARLAAERRGAPALQAADGQASDEERLARAGVAAGVRADVPAYARVGVARGPE